MVKTALVTGANRGIGRAIATGLAARGVHVIVAAREPESAERVVGEIRAAGGSAEGVTLDVGKPETISAAAAAISARHGHLDILINNAGIMRGMADTIIDASDEDLELSLAINAFGALRVTKAVLPLLRASRGARVINMSSTAGSIAETVDPASPYAGVETASYRLSKAALNVITALLAKVLRPEGITVNSVCPGWTRTDMGGEAAPQTPAEGADTVIWLALEPAGEATGGFYRGRAPLAW